MIEPEVAYQAHQERVEAFVEEVARSYIKDLSVRRPAPTSKEINDPVWGTLSLTALEVAVLDSPLLQRLRRLHQLGVAHYVFPGATHSRLEHSLGVLHQVQRLVGAINSDMNKRGRDGSVIDQKTLGLLRLAALCHDIGHGVMSHVSENALRFCPEVRRIILGFTKATNTRCGLDEINSYLIIGSRAFGDLLSVAQSAANVHIAISDLQYKLQQIVIGHQIDDEIPLVHELISGPFDADKLDYMARDAYMTGIPSITDVDRLINKVRAISIGKNRLPESLLEGLSPTTLDTVVITGLAKSGNRTLDELTVGRILLTDKVYRHQKLRSVEAMVASIFRCLADLSEDPCELGVTALRMDDDELVNLDKLDLSHYINLKSPEDGPTAEVLTDLVQRLQDRRLFVRAISFAQRMPSDPFQNYLPHADGLTDLIGDLYPQSKRAEYAAVIAQEAEDAISRAGDSDVLNGLPGRSLIPYVWIDPPDTVDDLGATATALLISSDGVLQTYKQEAPETEMWAIAYTQTRDTGYVFCPAEFAPYVTLATERRLRTDFEVRIPQGMMPPTWETHEDGINSLDSLKRKLVTAGFYDGYPRDLLPLPLRLLGADVENRLEKIAERLRGYLGPMTDLKRMKDVTFGSSRIRDFIAQFEDYETIGGILHALSAVRFVEPKEIAIALSQFLDDHSEFQAAALVPLGEPKDSSALAGYFARQIGTRFLDVDVLDLGTALEESDRPIIFVDDICYTGGQAHGILAAWFGDPSPSEALGEKRRPLPPQMQELLRTRKVAFNFIIGTPKGREQIIEVTEGLGFEAPIVNFAIDANTIATLSSVEYATEEQKLKVIARCKDIGTSLGIANGDPKAEERALGYGGRGLLLVFPYNTPAQTLRCLWDSSEGDFHWRPLFPRLKKT